MGTYTVPVKILNMIVMEMYTMADLNSDDFYSSNFTVMG